jgi:hypothetical protein
MSNILRSNCWTMCVNTPPFDLSVPLRKTAELQRAYRSLPEKGQAAEIIQQAKAQLERSRDGEKAEKEMGSLEHNLALLASGVFRKRGGFIGSGVVEAGCKTVIGQRMKCSGMFWSEEGGQGMWDWRCAFLSHRWDAFCQARSHHHAAPNDLLTLTA